MTLESIHRLTAGLGHPVLTDGLSNGKDSAGRFPDGSRYRVEIPSCEGPDVMAAVLDEAGARGVPVHRVSQGSGVMMLTDAEIGQMVVLGAEHDVEVNLFLGPRSSWDIGGQTKVSAAVGAAARGNAAVAASLCDAERAVRLGIRSLLVGDLGVLALLGRMKRDGQLPEDLVLKTSVLMPLTNGPTAALYEQVGATSLNISTDLTVPQIAEIRAATTVPIDMYVEVPDDQGGAVRFYDVPEVVRVAAPVYLKLGLRNAPNIYPVGGHLGAMAQNLGRERVRRAELVLRLLAELSPELAAVPTPATVAG
ncbi:U32 family peptidase [Blastococcus haudaquaticus]|uniref:Peptidase family U32 n=1 Tax=Blastococcus haudaquaticus TaxID=1938745 RepID=A0A286H7R8_9ACTN|nr:U32 family peptidase [Blastococcus haudaquaticus]SOE03845.1 Peptidase family U32 [Blastococcus haudaquaticus]